jgi:hypothetical protein
VFGAGTAGAAAWLAGRAAGTAAGTDADGAAVATWIAAGGDTDGRTISGAARHCRWIGGFRLGLPVFHPLQHGEIYHGER